MIFSDLNIATAIVTKGLAKRDMNIDAGGQRHRERNRHRPAMQPRRPLRLDQAGLKGGRRELERFDGAQRRDGKPNVALSDFVAPEGSGVNDYIGGFVVTAGLEEERIAERFARANDDYRSIMVKALADRIAEAFAEQMHERVRREFWAYARDENLTNEQRIAEDYAGIRPAPGYPAQPDHTEKQTLFDLLAAERRIGVKLTESYAMWPGSSVSGLYFSHPDSYYFGVSKIERDQVEDYAKRKNKTVAEMERWLAPILNYLPGN